METAVEVQVNAQQTIAANVAARGYQDGWTTEQFVARQIAKAQEELSKAVAHIALPDSEWWTESIEEAGLQARYAFDDKNEWRAVEIDRGAIRSELADLVVVLFTAADALGFDLAQAAVDKSAADVARGVRNGEVRA